MTWALFPAPTWRFSAVCNSSSKDLDIFFWYPQTPVVHMVHIHMCWQNSHTRLKSKLKHLVYMISPFQHFGTLLASLNCSVSGRLSSPRRPTESEQQPLSRHCPTTELCFLLCLFFLPFLPLPLLGMTGPAWPGTHSAILWAISNSQSSCRCPLNFQSRVTTLLFLLFHILLIVSHFLH